MAFLFSVLMIVVFVAVVASSLNEGLWGNAITFFNVVISALLATNYWEPLSSWLSSEIPSARYLWDFLTLWAIFSISMFILRALTDAASKYKMKFVKAVDSVGGLLFSLATGWVLVAFLMMTLHTAPLAREFLGGGFDPEEQMFFGTAPDRHWLGFVQRLSNGPYRPINPDEGFYGFDPGAEFMIKYAARRKEYADNPAFLPKKNTTFNIDDL